MNFEIAVIPGDGIGPEITNETQKVLNKISELSGHKFNFSECCAATAAVKKYGDPIPADSLQQCIKSDAILLGCIHLDGYNNIPKEKRPNYVIMALRETLGLCTNVRPTFIYPSLVNFSPLKNELITQGMDIMIFRDLAGGMIMSDKYRGSGIKGREAFDKEYYNEDMIRKTVKRAFDVAMTRSKKLASLDKAVILESSKLWREIVVETALEYPEVEVTNIYVDDAAMKLIQNPSDFDVVVSTNVFGDIIADEISAFVGVGGLLPGASINEQGKGIYEINQIHNARHDIAGQNIANPIGSILSGALMLQQSFGLVKEASLIYEAVKNVIEQGYCTKDFMSEGLTQLGTKEMGSKIINNIEKLWR